MSQLQLAALFLATLCKVFGARAAFYVATAAYLAVLYRRFLQFRTNSNFVKDIPGKRYLLAPGGSSDLVLLLPAIPYIKPPLNQKINDPVALRKQYEDAGSTITSIVSAFTPRITLQVSDPKTIRAALNNRHIFPKPWGLYRLFSIYGENVLITEGDEWKKHRKFVAPAFSEETFLLEWEVASNVAKDWMASLEARAPEYEDGIVLEPNMNKICLHIALGIIARTAFGVPIASPGQAADPVPPGHKYNLKDTLEGALDHPSLFTTIATPKWLLWIPLKRFKLAKEIKLELHQWLDEIVEDRKKAPQMGEERKDLLYNLVKANEALQDQQTSKREKGSVEETMKSSGKAKSEMLNPDELAGNLFIFLLAGHESSAHTLAFALGLLAIYPEEQEKLYEHIQAINPNPDAEVPYTDYTLYTRALAVVYETLRLYPAVIWVPKFVNTPSGALLPISDRGPIGGSETGNIFVPNGTYLNLDVQSLHHDPFFWPEPEDFRPDRFIDTETYKYNRNAFLPFSSGARACVGRKFAEVELVAILVALCRNYRIVLPKNMQGPAGETKSEMRSRILMNRSMITLTPLNLSLGFQSRV